MKDMVVRKRLVIVYLKEKRKIINQTFDRKEINQGFDDLKKIGKMIFFPSKLFRKKHTV